MGRGQRRAREEGSLTRKASISHEESSNLAGGVKAKAEVEANGWSSCHEYAMVWGWWEGREAGVGVAR